MRNLAPGLLFLLVLARIPAFADIVYPSSVGFITSVFYHSVGDTNYAEVFVEFNPSSYDAAGRAHYWTSDGTAVAGEDYEPASGDIYFGFPWEKSFKIRILPQPPGAPVKSINLNLTSDPGTSVKLGGATLKINFPPPPAMSISLQSFGYLNFSWIPDGSKLLVYSSTNSASKEWGWAGETSYWGQSGTNYINYISLKPTSPVMFYRLVRVPF